MRRRLGMIAAALLLASCSHDPEIKGEGCPAIITAEAWVNRMPGVSAPERRLIVSLRLDDKARWMLRPAEASSPDARLTLELVPGGSGHPGNAAWRGNAPDTARGVDILCGGVIHHQISEIMIVR